MKFITISDTHGKHKHLNLPRGDVLIHAGDISMSGYEHEIINFLNWFDEQHFQYKIFIAGNHDFYFERQDDDVINRIIPKNVIYLNDSGIVLDGIKIWGSPVTPWFFNWAFNRHRGDAIRKHWDLIPEKTDVLITHGPVFQVLDKTRSGQHVGCKDLLVKLHEVRPKVHICGHIHEAYGTLNEGGTKFINASILNERYQRINRPIEF